jgi:shikimate kinase
MSAFRLGLVWPSTFGPRGVLDLQDGLAVKFPALRPIIIPLPAPQDCSDILADCAFDALLGRADEGSFFLLSREADGGEKELRGESAAALFPAIAAQAERSAGDAMAALPGAAQSSRQLASFLGSLCPIFLVGQMASGKSSVGSLLARRLGFAFADSDSLIAEAEAAFRLRETAVLEGLAARRGIVVATGGGSVIAPGNRELMHSAGPVVWLYAPTAVLADRARRDGLSRPLLASPDPEARLRDLWAERLPAYAAVADILIPTSASSPEGLAEVIYDLYHVSR